MLVNIHMGPAEDQAERFDTLISPAGTIATLLNIEEQLGHTDIIGIDESYPGESESKKKIASIIEADGKDGRRTVLLFSLLIYNAERSLAYIHELKQAYGNRIIVGVGGQLVPLAEKAYLDNRDIDAVCSGDAEAILPTFLRDIERGELREDKIYRGWVKDLHEPWFSGVSYDNFWMIRERMQEQRAVTKSVWGKEFSQLTIQGAGGPGCAWAANNRDGACRFCALQNITQMNKTPLRILLENEANVTERFGADRFFDVANLFLPGKGKGENKKWLQEYIRTRKELGLTAKKYVYLTISSIDSEIAHLLKEAGIEEVYLGIDHFHPEALKEQNKPFRTAIRHIRSDGTAAIVEPKQAKKKDSLKVALDALKETGIAFRAGIVLGSAHETKETLGAVRAGVRWLLDDYRENVKAIGVFPVEIIPGSRVFDEMRVGGLCANLFKKFDEQGYLSREEQRELTRSYIDHNSEVKMEDILAVENEINEASREAGVREYTVDELHPDSKETTEITRQKFF